MNGKENETSLSDAANEYRKLNKKIEVLNEKIIKLQAQAKKEKQLNKRAMLVKSKRVDETT
ncbi:hypothetical protein T1J70_15365 (plasmid) [Lactiplantibacillus plantarum]|nr:hypothetical protein T1J70_15365 [Lactiplantibacillus plantarum]